MLAAIEGHEHVSRLLVTAGANLNARDARGDTPLLWASRNAHWRTVAVLIEGGAEIDVADEGGRTPLQHAACDGHVDTVKALLQRGARPGQSTASSMTW